MIAETLLAHLPSLADSCFTRAEVAGPGFINLFLSPAFWAGVVMAACSSSHYGRTDHGQGKKYNVEFVLGQPHRPHAHGQRPGRRPGRLPGRRPGVGRLRRHPGVLHQRRRQPDPEVRQEPGHPLSAALLRRDGLSPAQGVLPGRGHHPAGPGVRRPGGGQIRPALPRPAGRGPV